MTRIMAMPIRLLRRHARPRWPLGRAVMAGKGPLQVQASLAHACSTPTPCCQFYTATPHSRCATSALPAMPAAGPAGPVGPAGAVTFTCIVAAVAAHARLFQELPFNSNHVVS